MSPTPDDRTLDPQQLIAELQQQLAENNAERDHLRSERDEALAREAASAEVLQVINSSPGDLAPVFEAMLEKAMQLCKAEFGILNTYDGENSHRAAARGVPPAFEEWRLRQGPLGPGTMHGRIASGENVLHTLDLMTEDSYRDADPDRRAFVELAGARTALVVALRKEGTLLGTITIFRQEVRAFTDKQIALLQNFAAQAVIAIENARLINETQEALEQQTATAEVLQVINSSPGDLAPVFNAMLDKAMRLCGAAFGLLNTYDGESFHQVALRQAADARGQPTRFADYLAVTSNQPGRQRLRSGERLVHIADLSDEDIYRSGDPYRRAFVDIGGARTLLAVPLRKDNTLLGVVNIYRQEVRPFSDKQIALLENFAAQAVIAMENARLITETREALEQQTATAEVLQVINSSPGDLAPVFEAMLEKAMRLCDFDLASLWTYDGNDFHPVAMRGVPERFAEFLKENTPPAFVRLLSNDEPFIHFADVLATELGDTSFAHSVQELGQVRTLLLVPLRKDSAMLGVFTAYRQEVRPFTNKQIALLQNFAAQAVIAMENARLITETREALEQQTATAEVLGVINSSPGDLAPVFDAILEKAHTLCDAATGSLRVIDGDMIRAVAFRGQSGEFADRVQQGYPFASAPLLASLRDGAPFVHISDVAERDDSISRLSTASGNRTILAVPLRKDDALLGMIVAGRKEVRPFTHKEIALLQNFAAQAVIAMENARLITETREALEQQTATAEVLGVINSSPGDLAPVFDAILEKAHSLCGIAAGSLQVNERGKFRAVAMRGVPDPVAELLRRPFEPRQGSPASRLLGERFVHIADMADSARQRPDNPRAAANARHGIRTALYVPLRKDNDLLGYISAYRFEVRPFTDKQIALLQNFAAQAVIAIENARLLGELRQRTEEVGELNRDLEARVAAQVDELGRVGRLKRFLAPQLAELIVSHGDEKILESHRREIVVVFCDLRGYTAFTETAEPEEALDFLREYHGALGPLVSQFEGTLDQFSGDGIMVFFNDPVPIPDPAQRAVNMAVAMRSAANTLIADWRERGRDLGFGAGIAQGYATLGQIGFSERSGYTAIGTVCNVAARLCAEAKDGQILLSQLVNVALKGRVATEQLGALALKGLSQPVVAYNVPLGASQPALRVIEGGSPQSVP